MFRLTAIISFLLTVFLTALLFAIADKAAGKAVFVVFLLPTYLMGSCALVVVALLNHYAFKADFKLAFPVAVAVSTMVMIGGDTWLNDDNIWLLIKARWPVYSIFLGVHTAAYFWFLDEVRYKHFRALF